VIIKRRKTIVCPVLRRLITTLVSFGHCIVYPVLRRLIITLVSFGHCRIDNTMTKRYQSGN
jgi:hypothetical protein